MTGPRARLLAVALVAAAASWSAGSASAAGYAPPLAPGQWQFAIVDAEATPQPIWDPVPGGHRKLLLRGRLASPAPRLGVSVFLRMQPASAGCAPSWRSDHGAALESWFVLPGQGSIYAADPLPAVPAEGAVRICAWVARSDGARVRPVTQVIPLLRGLFGAMAATDGSYWTLAQYRPAFEFVVEGTAPFSISETDYLCGSSLPGSLNGKAATEDGNSGIYGQGYSQSGGCAGDSETYGFAGVAGNPSFTFPNGAALAPGAANVHVGNACVFSDGSLDTVAEAAAVVRSEGCKVGQVLAAPHPDASVPAGEVLGLYIDGAQVLLVARGTTVDIVTNGVPPPPPPPSCSTSCGDDGMGGPAPTCANHSVTLPGGVTVEASCFHIDGDGRLTATGHIRVNGLDLVINGSGGFTLSTKQLTLTADADVDAYAGSLHIYHGHLDWNFQRKLPLGVPPNFKIKGLPVDGDITLSLAPGGVDAVANATIGESSFQVSGTIDLKLTLQSGLELNSFKLDLSSDVPIRSLVVQKAELSYEHTSSGDVWTGEVAVQLPAGPVVDGTLTLTNGAISEVGATVSGINKPLGEVIFLQSLGLKVVFVPHLSATGSIGLSAGPAIDGHTAASLDGSLTAQITDPFVLSAQGTLSLVDQQVADASVTATIPGGVTFNGSVGRSFGPIAIQGTVDGSITSSSFDAEGAVTAQTGPISATGDALVNNAGIAGCASADVFGFTLSIGGAHRWSGENSVFHDACGFGRLQSALGAHDSAVGGPQAVVRVPPHTRQVNIIVSGASGPPQVQLTHRKGQAIIVPNSEGRLGRMVYLAIADPANSETDIAIGDPGSGAIGISPAPGQSALTGVASSLPLPHPDVRVSLHRLGGRAYQLSWSARAIPGQVLVFQDRDATGVKQLIKTRRAHGALRFTALDNGARGQHTLRVLVEQNGLLRAAFPGARFQPATLRLAAPRVSVRVERGNAVIRWSSVRNAARYEMSVATSDGRHLFFAFGPHDRSLRVRSAAHVSVRVWALGPGGERGRPGTEGTYSKPTRHKHQT